MTSTSRLQITIESWKIRKIKSRTADLGHKNMGEYIWSLVKRDVPLDDLEAIKLREKSV